MQIKFTVEICISFKNKGGGGIQTERQRAINNAHPSVNLPILPKTDYYMIFFKFIFPMTEVIRNYSQAILKYCNDKSLQLSSQKDRATYRVKQKGLFYRALHRGGYKSIRKCLQDCRISDIRQLHKLHIPIPSENCSLSQGTGG